MLALILAMCAHNMLSKITDVTENSTLPNFTMAIFNAAEFRQIDCPLGQNFIWFWQQKNSNQSLASRSPFIRIRQHHVNENGLQIDLLKIQYAQYGILSWKMNKRWLIRVQNKMSTTTASETHLKTNYMSNKQQWVWNVCS